MMTDDIEKKADLDEAELKKVAAAAESKQLRHRLDEYVAMVIAIGAVMILWLLQISGVLLRAGCRGSGPDREERKSG